MLIKRKQYEMTHVIRARFLKGNTTSLNLIVPGSYLPKVRGLASQRGGELKQPQLKGKCVTGCANELVVPE